MCQCGWKVSHKLDYSNVNFNFDHVRSNLIAIQILIVHQSSTHSPTKTRIPFSVPPNCAFNFLLFIPSYLLHVAKGPCYLYIKLGGKCNFTVLQSEGTCRLLLSSDDAVFPSESTFIFKSWGESVISVSCHHSYCNLMMIHSWMEGGREPVDGGGPRRITHSQFILFLQLSHPDREAQPPVTHALLGFDLAAR